MDRVVLPSVGLPKKTTYNIPELMKILDCSKPFVYKLNHLGLIHITPHKRIYYKDIEQYLESSYDPVKDRKTKKKKSS